MRRTTLVLALLLVAAACGSDSGSTTTAQVATTMAETTTTTLEATPGDDHFPVTLTVANGQVEIPERPDSIVSLSPAATENLFAIGAGDQVVAVDDQSNFPAEAPVTDLSGFTPNTESILGYEPDLVVITYDPSTLVAELSAVGVPVLLLPSATSVDDAFAEIEILGAATGHVAEAAEVVSQMQAEMGEIVSAVGEQIAGVTIYHEVDSTLYSASSSSYVGELYEMLGLVNIADPADPDGFGYPQLSAELIIGADPDVILLADAVYGESAATLAARPGWEGMTALQNGAVVEVDPDLASRWTPRSVDLMRHVAESIAALVPVG